MQGGCVAIPPSWLQDAASEMGALLLCALALSHEGAWYGFDPRPDIR
jgi:hypothetical protein